MDVTPIDTKAKTKAQIMREWRQSQGKSTWSHHPINTYALWK
jgi:hypothetical protein